MKPEIINICPQLNPGIRKLASEQHIEDIMNFPKILEIARKSRPDLAFIGPDDPIGGGLADALENIDIPTVAPKRALARIESSKSFARTLMQKYGLDAYPMFRVFEDAHAGPAIQSFIESDLKGRYVVKYDALKGGKGVKVSDEHLKSTDEGVAYALDCIRECGRVVIEEKLIGCEFSLMSFVSGEQVVHMPLIQDHKRAYEGDTGPNTGGMGTYTDAHHILPFLTQADVNEAKELNHAIAKALVAECGEPYKGILYGGFIAGADGVNVIEYNARFGDPEALNVLPLLKTDFTKICIAITEGKLLEQLVEFDHRATVCKYITPKSYPQRKDEQGQTVEFPKQIPENIRIYFGDIFEDAEGTLRLGGSRTAGVVGIGKTIEEAERVAQSVCEQVRGPVRFRKDIGTRELIEERVRMMRELRQA